MKEKFYAQDDYKYFGNKSADESVSCDNCNGDADYIMNGIGYCEGCLEAELRLMFNELDIMQKAEVLGVEVAVIW